MPGPWAGSNGYVCPLGVTKVGLPVPGLSGDNPCFCRCSLVLTLLPFLRVHGEEQEW